MLRYFVLSALPLLAGLAFLQEPPQAEPVGSEMCLACHDVADSYSRTPHASAECESCHGPGSLHVETGGEASLRLRDKPATWTHDRCLSCHGQEAHLGTFLSSPHGQGAVSCISCHHPHPQRPLFGLLRQEEAELCLSCHPGTRAQLRRPFHHPVLEGTMQCSDCHSPHGEERQTGQRFHLATEMSCLSCHAEKKGPFVFEHAPLKVNDCQSCHQPHGSVNPRLLNRAEVRQLCLECHSLTPGVATSQPPAFHDLRSTRFQNCTVCHREIHGSYVSPVFLK